MLDISNLECRRGDRTLFSGLSFSLDTGELLYVHGRNGCGKTTLLRSVCGLFSPDDGEVRWRGEPVGALGEEYGREVVYVGHLNGIKGDLSGIENLRVAAILDGDRVEDEQVWAALAKVGLRGYEDLPTRLLSQGQKRRVALARLLLSGSRLWVLDEPFSALDSVAVGLLQSVIKDHIDDGGLAILTTHQEVGLTAGEVRRLHLDG